MDRRVGNAVVESIAAESPKFTAPMLLIHGLWCTAAVWRKFMGYLAHRGWSCHAVTLRGHSEAPSSVPIGAVSFADYLNDVRAVVTACDATPIVVGHDLGGLLALHCAAAEVRARIALAPLIPQPYSRTPNPALSRWTARLAMLRSQPLAPPTRQVEAAYFGGPVPGGVRPDSSRVAQQIVGAEETAPRRADVPTLVLAGNADTITPSRDVEQLAAAISATFRSVESASHAMPWASGWEQRVGEVHRWLIQTFGEALLLPREDEEE